MPRRNTPDHSYFDSVITELELSVDCSCSGGREKEHLSDKEGKSCSIVCDQLGTPTEAYDEEGKAPMMRVVIRREFDVVPKAKDISMELHHWALPQRLKTPKANELLNLIPITPWGHASMDSCRHIKYKLDRIIKGIKIW